MTLPARITLRTVTSLLVISLLAFAVISAMPSDPVAIAIRAWNLPPDGATVAGLRAQWGLDRPFLERYGAWLARFVRGDWGLSFRTGEPVLAEFLQRLPLTMTMALSGLALAPLLAVPLGFLAALRPSGWIDRATRGLAVFVQAVPSIWLGLILLYVLGVQLRWIRPFTRDWSGLILPVALIALHSLAVLTRVYRRDLLEVTRQPFFRTALAKGLTRAGALWRHGHAHALYAMISAFRAEASWAVGSTAALEVLFGLPGIGQFLVESIAARDYPVLQAYVMVVAAWLLVLNAGVALCLAWLGPSRP
ncbi:ABC transporter permease [Kaistia defluvii]|uniref:ABC transporter permease n=1 Tax=Kaistia defluvii TaxID=410841 RepID=UPI00224ECDFF|nr:ABC transporter permease [Kaistia defluvii]MCX5520871.1 ABC transporter permease [Kaistia defluvii]